MRGSEQGERLQKILSRAGVASRRGAEEMIQSGRVSVNGEVVTELGARAVVGRDVISLNGKPVHVDIERRYLLFHKPLGMVTSLRDEKGRNDLQGVLRDIGERVFPVGRLDYDTSGLLLLTNDGDAAQVLAHPSFGVQKTYYATVKGEVGQKILRRLREGVELDDGPIAADQVKLIGDPHKGRSVIELTLHSGRNRIVRRMCEAVGHPVVTLQRRRFGPFHLGGLRPGQFRDFTPDQRHQLARLVELAKKSPKGES